MTKKILIAEDEDHIRTAVKLTIMTDGYEIFEARDGVEALEIAKRVKPDLLILDVMMAGQSGYQVCKILKSDPEYKNIYVLFLTARSKQKSYDEVKECGGDDFLEKPFGIRDLKEKVTAILGS